MFFRLGLDWEHQTTLKDCFLLCYIKQSRDSFEKIFQLRPYLSSYHYLHLLHSVCPSNVTDLPVLLLTKCLELQSVPVCACHSCLQCKSDIRTLLQGFFTVTVLCCSPWQPPSSSHEKKSWLETYGKTDKSCAKVSHIQACGFIYSVPPSPSDLCLCKTKRFSTMKRF